MSELYPLSKQIAPMKYCGSANDTKKDEALNSEDWYLGEKFDGALFQLEYIDDEHIYLFSRTVSKKTGELAEKIANVPHIKEWAKQLPQDTVLLGEIYIPGGHSNTVTTIMGCLPPKAIERQKAQGNVQYKVFDILYYNGESLLDKGFYDRYCYLENQLNNVWNETINYIPVYNDNKVDRLNEIFSHGGEGAVLKHKNCPYRPGMRTTMSQAFKLKEHIDSIDLVVMDLLDPEKEYNGKELDSWPYWEDDIPVTKPYYYGWKNSIVVGAYDEKGTLKEIGRVASGLTDELRADMASNPNDYLGSVVQLSCMSLDKKELTIRHPVFMQFRNDKPAADCKIAEIFNIC